MSVVAWTPSLFNWQLSVRDNGTANSNRDGGHLTSGQVTRIVEALASQLGGRVETSIEPDGTTICSLDDVRSAARPALPAGGVFNIVQTVLRIRLDLLAGGRIFQPGLTEPCRSPAG